MEPMLKLLKIQLEPCAVVNYSLISLAYTECCDNVHWDETSKLFKKSTQCTSCREEFVPWMFLSVGNRTSWKIFSILPFPKKNSIFIRQNSWRPFLVIHHKFEISPYFPTFNTFPPISQISSFPLFFQISPLISYNLRAFLHTLCVFGFPLYFDHDAFMHHTMHVLDTPADVTRGPDVVHHCYTAIDIRKSLETCSDTNTDRQTHI